MQYSLVFPCTWQTQHNVATQFLIRIFCSFINHWQGWNHKTPVHIWKLQCETSVEWTRTASFGNVGLWGELNLKKHSVCGQKAWLGGGWKCYRSSALFQLLCMLCSFGVLICSAAISRGCYSERNIINSWMQNKCGRLLQNEITSFSAFSGAGLGLFGRLNEIAVAGWILFCAQLPEVWSTWCCFQTGV